jgi:DeoR/GlpR family transcriptional regulator of sugar metabolism
MLAEERRQNILNVLKEKEFLRAEELAEMYNVSKITIVRDIKLLKDSQKIKKIHGGISIPDAPKNNFETRFKIRIQDNYSKKLDIASKALKYISDNQTIFLDSSSTVFVLASEILKKEMFQSNFISNSPAIVVEALNHLQANLICTGGELKQEFNIFGGGWVLEFLENINLDSAFISAAGVSENGTITTNNKDLAGILKAVFSKAKTVNLLIDSSKFFKKGMLDIAKLQDCRRIITDNEMPVPALKKLQKITDSEIIF